LEQTTPARQDHLQTDLLKETRIKPSHVVRIRAYIKTVIAHRWFNSESCLLYYCA
jgi:hypothetical protein